MENFPNFLFFSFKTDEPYLYLSISSLVRDENVFAFCEMSITLSSTTNPLIFFNSRNLGDNRNTMDALVSTLDYKIDLVYYISFTTSSRWVKPPSSGNPRYWKHPASHEVCTWFWLFLTVSRNQLARQKQMCPMSYARVHNEKVLPSDGHTVLVLLLSTVVRLWHDWSLSSEVSPKKSLPQ